MSDAGESDVADVGEPGERVRERDGIRSAGHGGCDGRIVPDQPEAPEITPNAIENLHLMVPPFDGAQEGILSGVERMPEDGLEPST